MVRAAILLAALLPLALACTESQFDSMTEFPQLLAPAANAVVDGSPVHFSWQPVPNAREYDLYINNVLTASTTDVNAFASLAVRPQPVSWYVEARNAFMKMPSNRQFFRFSVGKPTLVVPGKENLGCSSQLKLAWEADVSYGEYRVIIERAGATVIAQTVTESELVLETGLAPGLYTWRVQNLLNGEVHVESAVEPLVVEAVPTPIIVSPSDDPKPCLMTEGLVDWEPVDGASHYEYQVYEVFGTTSLTEKAFANLPHGIHTVQIRAIRDGCPSDWVSVQFEIADSLPKPPVPLTDNTVLCENTHLKIAWEPALSASLYELEFISLDRDAEPKLIQTQGTFHNLTNHVPGRFLWRVRATGDTCNPNWSEVRSLDIVAQPQKPQLVAVSDQRCVGLSTPVEFDWFAPDETAFTLHVGTITMPEATPGEVLYLRPGEYSWYVASHGDDPCESTKSDTQTFLLSDEADIEVSQHHDFKNPTAVESIPAAIRTGTCDLSFMPATTVCPAVGTKVNVFVSGESTSCCNPITNCGTKGCKITTYRGAGACQVGVVGPEGWDVGGQFCCFTDTFGQCVGMNAALCRWGTGLPFKVSDGMTLIAPGNACLQCGVTFQVSENDAGCLDFDIKACTA